MNESTDELQTCSAPAARRSSTCCSERTMLTSGMPSEMHSRLSIWPRFDAAAVCTSAVWPSRRIVPTWPRTVSGLTKHAAPSIAVTPAGSSRHCATLTQRYCEYIDPPSRPTVLPSSACAAGSDPAATTTPPPSLPTGIDSPTRPAIAFRASGAILAVTVEAGPEPSNDAVSMSAPPKSSPRSDGLIGAASTRTSTSLSLGVGTSTVCKERRSVPPASTRERS